MLPRSLHAGAKQTIRISARGRPPRIRERCRTPHPDRWQRDGTPVGDSAARTATPASTPPDGVSVDRPVDAHRTGGSANSIKPLPPPQAPAGRHGPILAECRATHAGSRAEMADSMSFRATSLRNLIASSGLALLIAGVPADAGTAAGGAPAPGLAPERLAGFVQYIRWPAEAELRRWEVCVPPGGGAPPESELPAARGRPIAVRVLAPGESVDRCQILDLTGLSPTAARALLDRARRLPVLTIGHGDFFCSAGGVICLRPAASGGGFEVNLSALQEAGLAANAQLLMLGRRRQAAGGTP
jgi:hypothetical protein